jgi:hypothetical protein
VVQAVSRRPLTAETQFRARVSLSGICGGNVALGQVFNNAFPVAQIIGKLRRTKRW